MQVFAFETRGKEGINKMAFDQEEIGQERNLISLVKSLDRKIDPLGRPTVTVVIIVFPHVSVCPYVSMYVPTFQNLAKQNKFQAKTMFTSG